tara:strand:+ start:5953 stop:6759 length:807 start_codon:yes stop_codon:yes gene_type:complete
MNLELKKFDMRSIPDGKVIVFVGKRETGKSFLVRDLLYYKQDTPVGCVISGTEGANSFYSKIVPGIFIHNKFDDKVVHNYMKRQKKVVKAAATNSRVDPRAFLILDDCLYDPSWTKNTDIRSLFMNGRHYYSMFIITMQYSLGIPPSLRTNIDYIFILRENIQANRKRLYEQYAGMFQNLEVFNQVMDQCTENYECLVINNNAKSNKLEDQVFWYKATDHSYFKIGHPSIWQHHQDNYNPNHDDSDEDEFDINRTRKKKGTLINIKKV